MFPNGDYYVFLSEDRTNGTFGHPWEQTLCIFGTSLIPELARPSRSEVPHRAAGGGWSRPCPSTPVVGRARCDREHSGPPYLRLARQGERADTVRGGDLGRTTRPCSATSHAEPFPGAP
ncbi:DUF2716 domain-containing protein [Nonomuraea sp. MTCD27]|uniref:DUF2716 domain-containing protein n=1 Tax=Nonomuraea sp. MTCD27 TaxID=1676747 RepID=UPI0035C08126